MSKSNNKKKKKIKCIFCGVELNNKNRTIEHIIPKSIYNTNKLVIRNFCKKCNNKLGRICEQPAIPYLKEYMAELILRGYPLKYGRRKNKVQFIDQGIGWGAMTFGEKREGMPCKMQIDIINKRRVIDFQPNWIKKDYLDFSDISSDNGTMIFPIFENKGIKELQHLSQKIIFELCYVLWKEDFLITQGAKMLKKLIFNLEINESNTENLKWDNPVFSWKELEGIEDEKKSNSPSKTSIFDNPPNITFAILIIKNLEPIIILNLFGFFEMTIRLFKDDSKLNEKLKRKKAIFLIIKLTEKKGILILNHKNYLKWQKNNLKA